MYCDKITFVLFAYNEEKRIERAVRNFVGTGRVLVVDNHSTDRTCELAELGGASVLKNKNAGWVEDEKTASVVKNAVTTPWIYWAYADEMVDRSTLAAIIGAVEADDCAIISLVRKNYYYGKFCHNAYADATNRVFKKDAIDFVGNEIHHFGKVIVPGSLIRRLDPAKFFVHHFISHTAKVYLRSIDSYSDTEPKRQGPHSAARIIISTLKTFFENYVWRRGYKAGLPGLFVVVQQAYYGALLNMKRYEASNNLVYETIEDQNNKIRDRLLKSFD